MLRARAWLRCPVQVALLLLLLLLCVTVAASRRPSFFLQRPPLLLPPPLLPPSLHRSFPLSSPSSSSSSFPLLWGRFQTGERREVKKRSSQAFGSFYRLMQRHGRYLDERAFVEQMFRLFDMNADDVIERDEFRAILQLLGLVSHAGH